MNPSTNSSTWNDDEELEDDSPVPWTPSWSEDDEVDIFGIEGTTGGSVITNRNPKGGDKNPYNGIFGDKEQGSFDIEMDTNISEILDKDEFKPGKPVDDDILDFLNDNGFDPNNP